MSPRNTKSTSAKTAPKAKPAFSPNQSVGYLINATARLFSRALNERLLEHGVSIGQWPVLMFLWEEEGLNQQEVSRRSGVEESTLARTIERMERDGLIKRQRSTKDRRHVELTLTPRARELRRPLLKCAASVNEKALAGLSTEDVERMMQCLAEMKTRLESDQGALDET